MNTRPASLTADPGRRLVTWCLGATVLGTAALAVALAHVTGRKPSAVYKPAGFVDRTFRLIERRHLAATSDNVGPHSPVPAVIEFDERGAARADVDFFRHSTRLQREIRRHNTRGEGLFQIGRGGEIKFDELGCTFPLPYPSRDDVRLTLDGAADWVPAFVGEGVVLAFPADAAGAQEPGPGESKAVPLAAWLPASAPATAQTWQGRAFALRDGGRDLVRLWLEEKGVRLEVVSDEFVTAAVNGEAVETRRRRLGGKIGTVLLEDGDRIRLTVRQPAPKGTLEARFRFGRTGSNGFTRSYLENGRLVSVVDATLAAQLPWAQQLNDAFAQYVASLPEGAAVGQSTARLTVDPAFHQTVQDGLVRYVRDFDQQRSSVPGIEYQPAAVTVMDALSGDVLAMASYPTAADLDRWRRAGTAVPEQERERFDRLARNQNLVSIPIGSTTKPIIAAAVWEAHPHLRQLVVAEPEGQLTSVQGLRIHPGLKTVGPRTVDPVHALAWSSNAYMANLYLLSLADQEALRVQGGQPVAGSVHFGPRIEGDRIDAVGMEKLPAHRVLAEAFGVRLGFEELQPGVEARKFLEFDRGPLGRFFDELKVPADDVPAAFWGVTPRGVCLSLRELTSVRRDVVGMLVGSGHNHWSNLKLAEAFARLGSGAKVESTLFAARDAAPAAPAALPVSEPVLSLVRDGLTAAITDDVGTAHRLAPALAAERAKLRKKKLTLRAMGKTGTARRVSGRNERECAAFCLYLELVDDAGTRLSALSTAIYLQDRAAVRDAGRGRPENSAVAVAFAGGLLPDLVQRLEAMAAASAKK